jgi:hypothetical protein
MHLLTHTLAICVSMPIGLDCQTTTSKNTEMIISVLASTSTSNNTETGQLVHIVDLARTLQSTYIIGLLAGARALFAISLVFVALLKRDFKMSANNATSRRQNLLRSASMSTI